MLKMALSKESPSSSSEIKYVVAKVPIFDTMQRAGSRGQQEMM